MPKPTLDVLVPSAFLAARRRSAIVTQCYELHLFTYSLGSTVSMSGMNRRRLQVLGHLASWWLGGEAILYLRCSLLNGEERPPYAVIATEVWCSWDGLWRGLEHAEQRAALRYVLGRTGLTGPLS